MIRWMLLVDFFICLIWTGIGIYFLRRFLQYRRLVSIGLALMAGGWGSVGLLGMFGLTQIGPSMWQVARGIALFTGGFLLGAIYRVEKTGR